MSKCDPPTTDSPSTSQNAASSNLKGGNSPKGVKKTISWMPSTVTNTSDGSLKMVGNGHARMNVEGGHSMGVLRVNSNLNEHEC